MVEKEKSNENPRVIREKDQFLLVLNHVVLGIDLSPPFFVVEPVIERTNDR